ncbi:helix-turn-helix transcriptional regulator [Bacillus sp. FJAT-49736]|uniref:helix-turn-helix domain-containing protein n=1 Tax=Bacillus sp. FJAT-49736 TaxID=2833582 RepID=UPI001BC8F360|nr:helix-turn-helix transcriptional regulator [Bacillus sp. FJAT-49736]MBS4173499.1 helix-turn-helix transcriptional regulator [Bacillus sp. FJAT-49736]
MPDYPKDFFIFKLEDLMWKNRIKSINELSEQTKISRSSLTAMKKGTTRMLHLPTVYTLCRKFNCGIDDLVQVNKEGSSENWTN